MEGIVMTQLMPNGENDTGALTLDEAGRVLVNPRAYADPPRFHQAAALLRRESPVHRVEMAGYPPFWAVTRHADVLTIATRSDVFKNEPRAILVPLDAEDRLRRDFGRIQDLVHIDDPRHRELRAITANWFKPRSLVGLQAKIAVLARRAVDRMAELGTSCDFAQDVALEFPLRVILSMLGLPESDYALMLKLTQELFGAEDPELARGASPEAFNETLAEFLGYFSRLVADRQANPTEDLASVIANAQVGDGVDPLTPIEQISYFLILATAGHDTTSASLAGGIHALVEHPDQLDRVRRDPSLIPTAADEFIRWVTPVKHFLRTAIDGCEVGGHSFEAGDCVLLSYWSANRDETAFAQPMRFDVARDPNRHLAFGFGAHHCLGATLARMEIKAFLHELLPRLDSMALAGDLTLSESIFVSGPKHLPVTYVIR
jgi:cytochrome P450